MNLSKAGWRIKFGLVVAVFLIVLKFGLLPLYQWRHDIIERAMLLNKAVAKKKALAGNEQRIEKLLKQARASIDSVLRFYYTGFSDPQALQLMLQKDLEAISARCGVKIKSSDWLPFTEGFITRSPIKIRCEASPSELMDFIASIEDSRHFLSIDRLRITVNQRAGVLIAELDISAYGVKQVTRNRS